MAGRHDAHEVCALPFTYEEVGATAGSLPAGFHHLHRQRVVGRGDEDYRAAVEVLMTWQMHRRAGVRVDATSDRAAPGSCVLLTIRLGPVSIAAPCRVIYVIEEAARSGFAYGTLPGHPEVGEESFIVTRHDDDVRFEVTAFSRPGRWYTTLGGPVARAMQARATDRYLTALTGT